MRQHRDLTSDPSAEGIALPEPPTEGTDVRSGGDPRRGPRSLNAAELAADDEQLAAGDEWDDPDRL
ncbi:hypothetical protein [Cellulomonas marina]|uniref:Uncharacterized protein n=1 Tax=Cellulomonas marina TaxID=988821 RepID=A0A1I0ZV80_9CELL|nr:hypothetical protein [Cellulomonas marina]GIG30543.1 hypothetical protein Cma02nite_31430 [Cellulomonas marina]SFB29669.1 hypothetical protein SAMN05421867_11324 [Cellulomonas marina]